MTISNQLPKLHRAARVWNSRGNALVLEESFVTADRLWSFVRFHCWMPVYGERREFYCCHIPENLRSVVPIDFWCWSLCGCVKHSYLRFIQACSKNRAFQCKLFEVIRCFVTRSVEVLWFQSLRWLGSNKRTIDQLMKYSDVVPVIRPDERNMRTQWEINHNDYNQNPKRICMFFLQFGIIYLYRFASSNMLANEQITSLWTLVTISVWTWNEKRANLAWR